MVLELVEVRSTFLMTYHCLSRTRGRTGCRKAKSRCEGSENPPCQRCIANGLECLFEVPAKDQFRSFLSATSERPTLLVEEQRLNAVEEKVQKVDEKLDRVLQLLSAKEVKEWPELPGFAAPKQVSLRFCLHAL